MNNSEGAAQAVYSVVQGVGSVVDNGSIIHPAINIYCCFFQCIERCRFTLKELAQVFLQLPHLRI